MSPHGDTAPLVGATLVAAARPSAAGAPGDTQSGTARLVIACPDRPGLVAYVTTFLAEAGANIHELAQHSTDPVSGRFFMRVVFHLPGLDEHWPAFTHRLDGHLAGQAGLSWRCQLSTTRQRVALLVSRHRHCLRDLLWRHATGSLPADIRVVISNHRDAEPDARSFGIPFVHVPVTKDTKPESEARILSLLHEEAIDAVVLARYMQILSGAFLEAVQVPCINIHHSFLPAFAGADPYRRAKERGVKIIGATAHYVTEELDAGPIIEQDVAWITHRDSASDLERVGADVECRVLSRAVALHLDDRAVVAEDGTTIIF